MPTNGKKSLTLYSETIEALWEGKEYGETWDAYLLNILEASGRDKHTHREMEKVEGSGGKGQGSSNV